jgi:hypothetical protein
MRSLYAIVLFMLVVILTASACTSTKPPSDTSPRTVDTSSDQSKSKDSATLDQSGNPAPGKPQPIDKGTTTDKGGLTLPPGWPKDVPVMDGLNLQHAQTTQGGIDAMLVGDVPIEKVEAFYSGLSGWIRQPDSDAGSMPNPGDQPNKPKNFTMIKGTDSLTVTLGSQGAGTSVRLFYSKR